MKKNFMSAVRAKEKVRKTTGFERLYIQDHTTALNPQITTNERMYLDWKEERKPAEHPFRMGLWPDALIKNRHDTLMWK